jgi:hypothetical protein
MEARTKLIYTHRMRYNRGLRTSLMTSQKSTKFKTSLCADTLRHMHHTNAVNPTQNDLIQIAAKTSLVPHFGKHGPVSQRFVTQCTYYSFALSYCCEQRLSQEKCFILIYIVLKYLHGLHNTVRLMLNLQFRFLCKVI